MRVPKAGNGGEGEEEEQEMIVEMEKTGHVWLEREGTKKTEFRDEEEGKEEDRRADEEVGRSGHLSR